MTKHSKHYSHRQVMKIARMKAMVTEGLESGEGKRSMEALRQAALKRVLGR